MSSIQFGKPLAAPSTQTILPAITSKGMLMGFYFTEFLLHNSPLMAADDINWLEGTIDVFLHGVLKDPA